LHLIGILFPHINDDTGQNHIKFKNMRFVSVCCTSSDEPFPKPVSISGEVLAHRRYCAITIHVASRWPLTS